MQGPDRLVISTNISIADLCLSGDSVFDLNGYTCYAGVGEHPIQGVVTNHGAIIWGVFPPQGTIIVVR
jgi:hypothetical protein